MQTGWSFRVAVASRTHKATSTNVHTAAGDGGHCASDLMGSNWFITSRKEHICRD